MNFEFDEKKYRRKTILKGFLAFLIFVLIIGTIGLWIYYSPSSLLAFLKYIGFALIGVVGLSLVLIIGYIVIKLILDFFYWIGDKLGS